MPPRPWVFESIIHCSHCNTGHLPLYIWDKNYPPYVGEMLRNAVQWQCFGSMARDTIGSYTWGQHAALMFVPKDPSDQLPAMAERLVQIAWGFFNLGGALVGGQNGQNFEIDRPIMEFLVAHFAVPIIQSLPLKPKVATPLSDSQAAAAVRRAHDALERTGIEACKKSAWTLTMIGGHYGPDFNFATLGRFWGSMTQRLILISGCYKIGDGQQNVFDEQFECLRELIQAQICSKLEALDPEHQWDEG